MTRMLEISFNESPFEELETFLRDQDLGAPDVQVDKWYSKVKGYIADSPIAFSLKALYEKADRSIPAEIDLYDRFSLWLIPNRVSIQKPQGFAEPVSLGIEVEYRNDDEKVSLNKGQTFSIVSMLPDSEFIELGHLSGEIRGHISAAGEAGVDTDALDLASHLPLSENLKVGASAKVAVGLGFSFKVFLPIVSASGKGSSCARWEFDERSGPLYGKDIETWTVLVLKPARYVIAQSKNV